MVYKLPLLSPVNLGMRLGVVIRVVKVAFFGDGSLLSSSPQAEEPPKSGTGLGVGVIEKKIPVNSRKTTRPNHRDFIALASVSVVMFQTNQFGLCRHPR
jgi:hypothetical protein